jgi:hypothetical protein
MKSTLCCSVAGLVSVFIMLTAGEANSFSKVRVRVDPRIELLSIVQCLADYDSELVKIGFPFSQFNKDSFPYKNSLMAHFLPQKNHPAVLYYKEMLKNGC